MSVITEIRVSTDDFSLGQTLLTDPSVRIRLEAVIPTDGSFIPYIWVADSDVERIEATLWNGKDIDGVTIIDTTDDKSLVRIAWEERPDGLIDAITETRATILTGVGDRNGWRFQIRFDDHDQLSEFYRRCIDSEVTIEVASVHNPGILPDSVVEIPLTDAQREILRLAHKRGYFDVPRRNNLTELADELGISDTAVSQRLRRGLTEVLEATLFKSDAQDQID